MSNIEARGPGRPPKQNQSIGASIKKGKPTWKPASAMEVLNKEPGYRYRWSNKLPDNLAKKDLEGWETISGLQGDRSKHVDADRIQDGKPMTSIRERHDCVLQRIPEELAEARDEYMNNRTELRTQALTAHVKDAAGKLGVTKHGKITISSLQEEQFIE